MCCVWRHSAKARRYSRASVTCAYVHWHANCCFQIYSTSSYLRSVENFTQIQIDLDLASPLTILFDMDPRSRVASPNVAKTMIVLFVLYVNYVAVSYLIARSLFHQNEDFGFTTNLTTELCSLTHFVTQKLCVLCAVFIMLRSSSLLGGTQMLMCTRAWTSLLQLTPKHAWSFHAKKHP